MYLASEDLSVTTALAQYRDLAKALRRGAKKVTPEHGEYGKRHWLTRRWHGCALCAIAVGLNKTPGVEITQVGSTRSYLNDTWGESLLDEIEFMFEEQDARFEEIAGWLESL